MESALLEIEMVQPMLTIEEMQDIPTDELAGMLPALPEELQRAAAELIEQREAARLAKLKDLCKRLESKRDRSVNAKRSIEQRWAEDKRQLVGMARIINGDRSNPRPGGSEQLPPGLNLTASRSMIWSARVTNMMVPGASGQPWTVNPTPSPDVWGSNGEPVPPEQAKQLAESAASGMREEIKDQWSECHVPQQVRMAANDLVEIGVGILCGPENVRRRKRKFRKLEAMGRSVIDVQIDERNRPAWRRVDPRYFYPEMVESIDKARYAFEVIPLSSSELKDLSRTEGFEQFRDEFHEVLEKKPDLGQWALNVNQWNETAPFKDAIDDRYAVWKFVGYLDREDSETLGCECMDFGGSDGESELDREEQMIEVWFCDGHILKADPYILDGSDRLPYYVVPFFKLDDTMFGGSLPWRARDAQDSIHALWHALQYNVSISSGVIGGFMDGKVEAADGDMAIRGPKWMRIIDPDVKDIREVLSFAMVPNNSAEIMAVLKFRIETFDEEINLPLVAQGQPSESVPTSSGLAMLMNAANIAQKDIAQACEDGWLVPMLESAYAWNMLHSERDDIKGDFDCIATLTSDNVFKDLKAQRLMMLHNMRATDPELQLRVRPDVLYAQIAQAMEVDAALFYTEEEVAEKQKQPQAPDPMLALKEQEIAIKERKIQSDNDIAQGKLEIAAQDSQTKQAIAQLNVEQAFAELALQEDLTLAQIQAGIQKARELSTLKQQDMGVKARVEAEKLAARERADAVEIAAERNRTPGPVLA